MRRRWTAVVGAMIVVLLTGSAALAVTYDGEHVCRNTPAWPDGSYLGQMHPAHVTHYTQHARALGKDRCESWALDQRYSAVAGLRALGYTIFGPGEFAWPVPPTPPAPLPLPTIERDMLAYRQIFGDGPSTGVMTLVRGIHTVGFMFDGWSDAPVRVELHAPDGSATVVHDGPLGYSGSFTIHAPQTGPYAFHVHAVRTWRLDTGERSGGEINRPALTIAACEALLDG